MKYIDVLLIVTLFFQSAFSQEKKNKKHDNKVYYNIESYTLAKSRMDSIVSTLFELVSLDINEDTMLIKNMQESGFVASDCTVYETKLFECKFLLNSADTLRVNSSEESNVKFLEYLIENKEAPYEKIIKVQIKLNIAYGAKHMLFSNYEMKLNNESFIITDKDNIFRKNN